MILPNRAGDEGGTAGLRRAGHPRRGFVTAVIAVGTELSGGFWAEAVSSFGVAMLRENGRCQLRRSAIFVAEGLACTQPSSVGAA